LPFFTTSVHWNVCRKKFLQSHNFFNLFLKYLGFSMTSVTAQVKELVVIFWNSSITPIPAETVRNILSLWSPYIGIPTTGTPRLTVSCVLRSPPWVMNSLTFRWATEATRGYYLPTARYNVTVFRIDVWGRKMKIFKLRPH
jgi:hypothetical protein